MVKDLFYQISQTNATYSQAANLIAARGWAFQGHDLRRGGIVQRRQSGPVVNIGTASSA